MCYQRRQPHLNVNIHVLLLYKSDNNEGSETNTKYNSNYQIYQGIILQLVKILFLAKIYVDILPYILRISMLPLIYSVPATKHTVNNN